MKKLSLILTVLLVFSSISLLSGNETETKFHVLDKRFMQDKEGENLFVIIFVKYVPHETVYEDFTRHRRLRVEVESEKVYDLLAKGGNYSASDLATLGIKLNAEQPEDEVFSRIAEIKEQREKSQDDIKPRLKEIFMIKADLWIRKAYEINVTAYSIAQDRIVDRKEMQDLQEKTDLFNKEEGELNSEANSGDENAKEKQAVLEKLRAEYADEYKAVQEARHAVKVYFRAQGEWDVFRDNKQGEVRKYFQKLVGADEVKVKTYKGEDYYIVMCFVGFIVALILGAMTSAATDHEGWSFLIGVLVMASTILLAVFVF